MFEIFVGANYDFMGKRRYAYMLSAALLLVSIGSLIVRGGPRESIDFTGGAVLDVGFSQVVAVADVRSAAMEAGIEGAEIQMVEGGREAILRLNPEQAPANPFTALKQRMEQDTPGLQLELRQTETVGPKVGKELEAKAAGAILWSLVLILIYIAWRFTKVSFGIAAVLALFFNITVTLGSFSVLNLEISLTVIAAFLTIAGYSINDTIVVFDRIRENRGLIKRKSLADLINVSVNQTLSRTVLTGGSTFLGVLALYFIGGSVLHDFAFAMLVGMVVGTYSSIFVASALALDIQTWWDRRQAARAEKAEKAGKEPKKGSRADKAAVTTS